MTTKSADPQPSSSTDALRPSSPKARKESLDGGGSGVEPDKDSGVVEAGESFTEEEERAVVRKIDLAILPMICLVFFLQYLDKQSLSYASVFGLITDLNMTSSQYSWCSSIFYIGQLVSEFPFMYLMSRLHLSKFVGGTVIVWGIVCMCLAAPQGFAGFAAVRFLLGFAEGAVSPAFVTLTSVFYRKQEHAVRTAIWITMNGLAQVIGCLLMYGVAKNTSLSLAPWRTMFLICGAMTSAAGVLFTLLMPTGPRDAWFLTARERHVLSLRMVRDREGGDKTSFSVAQLQEALLDPKAWFVFWFGILVTMQSPVLTFASLVIKSLGYTSYQTILYTAPSGAVQVLLLWLGVAACVALPRNRALVAMALVIPPLVGTVFLMKLDTSAGWGMIVASWLASCITAPWSVLLSLTASNVKGNTKRSVVNALFFIGYCVGCIASPQLWTDSPRYFSGVVCGIVTWCTLFVAIAAYRFVCARDNNVRDAAAKATIGTESGESAAAAVVSQTTVLDETGAAKVDLTDLGDREFRYSI
ncbi:hypothetical protein HK405_011197 [Cladochytrium tenue]|nr:hypothetical protein HK405_011197 [Cladochytrium tenue]